jgi:PAS domain S-box-containing protein
MDDVWFGEGSTQADFETCLRALSLQGKHHPPLLAVATAGASPRLILASRALFAIFGVTSGEALSERLLEGPDPGARRLNSLSQRLTLDGAPRLERMRFFLGPGTEVITFICRRLPKDGTPLFVAAALGVRPGLIPADTAISEKDAAPSSEADRPFVDRHGVSPMSVQAIQATLRMRWPTTRTVRFLWQSDADLVCTLVTSPLGDIVGAPNADLVGRDLARVAAQIDPSGALAKALATKATWSGLDVDWPITDAPAAVSIGLGAIPIQDQDKAFQGYRGYGVIYLDRITAREPLRFVSERPGESETANVFHFPVAKALSPEDEQAFVALGGELRGEAGLDTSRSEVGGSNQDADAEIANDTMQPASDNTTEDGDIASHGLAILDRLDIGVMISRGDVPIFANRYLLDCLGFADEDALYEAGGVTHLFDVMPAPADGSATVELRHRDGRIIPVRTRIQTMDWNGLPTTLLSLQPVTPPPQTDTAALAADIGTTDTATEARDLRAILETATDGVVVIDADGNVTSLNRSGEALFGCDRGTVIGKPFLGLFAPNNQDLAADYLNGLKSNATKRLLNDGREFFVNAHRGGTIPVFMTLGRLGRSDLGPLDEAPESARFCALFRDLTHWKKVEHDLEAAKRDAERANALKSDVLAKVSHEVRTPLNAIIGFAEMMIDERFGPVGNDRYKDYLRDIQASGNHVMSLINDLLDLSKIEAGKMDLAVDTVDANKLIGECVALMQPQASGARIIMRLSLAPTLPLIKADARSLRQIVLNLLSNAVKFNEPGGQVIVATAMPETGHVVIRIRDTGHGMSDADIAEALEPFRQLSPGRGFEGDATAEGTGLGLPLTKALVEANEASFSIKSKVDHGTLVEIAFPPARVLAG